MPGRICAGFYIFCHKACGRDTQLTILAAAEFTQNYLELAMGRIMIGVVLWSDNDPRKAVIWCEDQGDLAFYTLSEKGEGVDLSEGDLVQFDLYFDKNIRRVRNPLILQASAGSGLAGRLPQEKPEQGRAKPPGGAKILPFPGPGRRVLRRQAAAH